MKTLTLEEQIRVAKLDREEHNNPTLGRSDVLAQAFKRALMRPLKIAGKGAPEALKTARSVLGSIRQFRPYLEGR